MMSWRTKYPDITGNEGDHDGDANACHLTVDTDPLDHDMVARR
jgi:hypothetical protein